MASDFKSAFRAARASGKSVFTWNGKSYNTKLKEDGGPATPKARPPAAVDGPKARPPAAVDGPKARPPAAVDGPKARPVAKRTKAEATAERKANKATNKAARYESRAKRNAAPAISSDTKDKRQNVADKFMAKNRLYKKGGMVKKDC